MLSLMGVALGWVVPGGEDAQVHQFQPCHAIAPSPTRIRLAINNRVGNRFAMRTGVSEGWKSYRSQIIAVAMCNVAEVSQNAPMGEGLGMRALADDNV